MRRFVNGFTERAHSASDCVVLGSETAKRASTACDSAQNSVLSFVLPQHFFLFFRSDAWNILESARSLSRQISFSFFFASPSLPPFRERGFRRRFGSSLGTQRTGIKRLTRHTHTRTQAIHESYTEIRYGEEKKKHIHRIVCTYTYTETETEKYCTRERSGEKGKVE